MPHVGRHTLEDAAVAAVLAQEQHGHEAGGETIPAAKRNGAGCQRW